MTAFLVVSGIALLGIGAVGIAAQQRGAFLFLVPAFACFAGALS